MCKIKTEDDKNYSQIHLGECRYEEKKRHIKGKIVIPNSNKNEESDEGYDDSTK